MPARYRFEQTDTRLIAWEHSATDFQEYKNVIYHNHLCPSLRSKLQSRHFAARAATIGRKGEKYRLIDLYADGFNPAYTKEELALFNQGKALDPLVLHYQELLKTTNRLIFIFPIWWADMPAIVKGFEDKVFLKTFAYVPTATGLKGNLSHIKEALVISTSTAPTWYLKWFCGNGIGKAMVGHTLKGIGIAKRRWLNFGNMDKSTAEQRQAFLADLSRSV